MAFDLVWFFFFLEEMWWNLYVMDSEEELSTIYRFCHHNVSSIVLNQIALKEKW